MVCLATFFAFISPINKMLHRDLMHQNPVENELVMGFPLGWRSIYLARTPAEHVSTG
jgi:hypothetical protein